MHLSGSDACVRRCDARSWVAGPRPPFTRSVTTEKRADKAPLLCGSDSNCICVSALRLDGAPLSSSATQLTQKNLLFSLFCMSGSLKVSQNEFSITTTTSNWGDLLQNEPHILFGESSECSARVSPFCPTSLQSTCVQTVPPQSRCIVIPCCPAGK